MSLIDLSKYKFDADDVLRYNDMVMTDNQPKTNLELRTLIPGFIDRTFIITTDIKSHLFPDKNIEYLVKVKRIVDDYIMVCDVLSLELPARKLPAHFGQRMVFIPNQYFSVDLRWQLKEYKEHDFRFFQEHSYSYDEYMNYVRTENNGMIEWW